MEWRWTIAGELADGVVVVSWMPHPARPDYDRPFYGLARFVDEHPVDALCQCEHTNVPSAQGCRTIKFGEVAGLLGGRAAQVRCVPRHSRGLPYHGT